MYYIFWDIIFELEASLMSKLSNQSKIQYHSEFNNPSVSLTFKELNVLSIPFSQCYNLNVINGICIITCHWIHSNFSLPPSNSTYIKFMFYTWIYLLLQLTLVITDFFITVLFFIEKVPNSYIYTNTQSY